MGAKDRGRQDADSMVDAWWCEYAWVDGRLAHGVRIEADKRGIICHIEEEAEPAVSDDSLIGVVFPGLANSHSHAFHRALRGRTHGGGGTFWTWRDEMYTVAKNLTPENYYTLARATYAEMVLAGITCVGEFHYVHHNLDGTPYDEPAAMSTALRQAAKDAGLRITLLDTAYLSGGLTAEGHVPLNDLQQRFGDASIDRWAERVASYEDDISYAPGGFKGGRAIHSVRAVPKAHLGVVTATRPESPLHVHVSEQPAENEATLAHYGMTPTALLHDAGVLGPHTSTVHATHLTGEDIQMLGSTSTYSCFCPTTERDLADGIGPARALVEAGSALTLGSDQHAVVDHFEEMRAVEMHERLVSGQRGRFSPEQLIGAATYVGHRSMGWDGAGVLAVGAPADLVAVSLGSVRTAGSRPEQILYAATAEDVTDVVCGGKRVVDGGHHISLDVYDELRTAISAVVE